MANPERNLATPTRYSTSHPPPTADNLPEDILRQIFILYVTARPANEEEKLKLDREWHWERWSLPLTKYSSHPPIDPRILLSHVCSSWRHVMLSSSSEFWWRISIRLVGDRARILPVFVACAARAHTRLLDVSIYPPSQLPNGIPVKPIQDIIIPWSTRFGRLWLTLGLADTCEFFTGSGSFPFLEELELETIPRLETVADDALLKPTIEFPALRKLTWKSKGNISLRNMGFPWKEMTALYLEGICVDAEAALGVLQDCRSLEGCTLTFTSTSPTGLTQIRSAPTNLLPALRDANFGFITDSIDIYTAILSRFTLPHLSVLQIFQPEYGRLPRFQWSQTAYDEFCARSGFDLQALHLPTTPVNGDILTSLQATPTLRSVTIKIDRKDALPRWFFSGFRIGLVLPQVEELKVFLQESGDASREIASMIVSMLMSRHDYLTNLGVTVQDGTEAVTSVKTLVLVQLTSTLLFNLPAVIGPSSPPRYPRVGSLTSLSVPITSVGYVIREPDLRA